MVSSTNLVLRLLTLFALVAEGSSLSIPARTTRARVGAIRCEEPEPSATPDIAPTPAAMRCSVQGCEDGRIMGGLAAIELFKWWPIKVRPFAHARPTPQGATPCRMVQAYRPCPECAAQGLQYRRSGQTLWAAASLPQARSISWSGEPKPRSKAFFGRAKKSAQFRW